jgi:hypothetical protein
MIKSLAKNITSLIVASLLISASVGNAGWVSSGKPSMPDMQSAQKSLADFKPDELKGKVCPIIKEQEKLKELAKKTGCTPAK